MQSVPTVYEPTETWPQTADDNLAFFWRQFTTKFSTEADCWEELCRRAEEEGFLKCRHCGSTRVERKYGKRVVRCAECNKKTWITAGTFFDRIRRARPWLAAIWLMEQGVSLSSARFHRLVDIAYSSALSIFKKLTMVILSQFEVDAFAVHSSLLSRLICRRSRETPARAHPLSEQEEIERNNQGAADLSSAGGETTAAPSASGGSGSESVGDPDYEPEETEIRREGGQLAAPGHADELSGLEQDVYSCLSSEPVHFDELCARTRLGAGELSATLVTLELAGAATRMVGDWYVRHQAVETVKIRHMSTRPASDDGQQFKLDCLDKTLKTVADVIYFVRRGFQGVSRKYLQNYAAAYWCHIDRDRWQAGALLRECLRSRPISYDEIIEYVSPIMIQILPDR